ncbi:hypothetical protein AHAS_Ahas05G0177900 [Arachis hypogaea]
MGKREDGAVKKEESLSERKSSVRKESRCASIAAVSSRSAVAKGSRRCRRLHRERTTLRTHRRDRRVEIGRRRKKEEALFALLYPVAVRGVIVVADVRVCITEPLSPKNSAASPGFTIGKGVLPFDFDFFSFLRILLSLIFIRSFG